MKVTYHVPTEQYGFVEVEQDFEEGEELLSYAHVKKTMFPNGDGLTDKDFNKAIDRYLTQGDMDSEAYESMSDAQKDVIQCIKRANKRIKAKGSVEEPPF